MTWQLRVPEKMTNKDKLGANINRTIKGNASNFLKYRIFSKVSPLHCKPRLESKTYPVSIDTCHLRSRKNFVKKSYEKKAGKFKYLGNALLAGKVVIFFSSRMKISGTDADTKYLKGLTRFARSAWIKSN